MIICSNLGKYFKTLLVDLSFRRFYEASCLQCCKRYKHGSVRVIF